MIIHLYEIERIWSNTNKFVRKILSWLFASKRSINGIRRNVFHRYILRLAMENFQKLYFINIKIYHLLFSLLHKSNIACISTYVNLCIPTKWLYINADKYYCNVLNTLMNTLNPRMVLWQSSIIWNIIIIISITILDPRLKILHLFLVTCPCTLLLFFNSIFICGLLLYEFIEWSSRYIYWFHFRLVVTFILHNNEQNKARFII